MGVPAVARAADEHGVVGLGADLEPGTLLAAYRQGLFPMHVQRGRMLAWWSPDPRGVLPLDGLKVSRSLRQSCRQYDVRVDTAFDQVLDACGDPRRPGAWIDRDVEEAYRGLHRLGWAHSVEAWDEDGLAGGLYGVAVGGIFAGESMFHRRTDASKVALVGLVDLLRRRTAATLARRAVGHATPAHARGPSRLPRATYLRPAGRRHPGPHCETPSRSRPRWA